MLGITNIQIHRAFLPHEQRLILEEADRLLASSSEIDVRVGLLAWIGMTTGLRVSELAMLRLEDFDLSRRVVHCSRLKKRGPGYLPGIAHSGAVRDWTSIPVKLAERIELVMVRWQRKAGPLFCKYEGQGVGSSALRVDWLRFMKRIGLPPRHIDCRGKAIWGCHAMRHTVGSNVGYVSRSAFAVRDKLGHAGTAVAAQYVDRNPQLLSEIEDQIMEGILESPQVEIKDVRTA